LRDIADKRGTLHTSNPALLALLDDCARAIDTWFAHSERGVYVMGSLARGGFSELASDIDVAVVFAPGLPDDVGNALRAIAAACTAAHPSVGNGLSLLWSSVETFDESDGGNLGAFDKRDLVDHAVLWRGSELRSRLRRVSSEELEVEGAHKALDSLLDEAGISLLVAPEKLLALDQVRLSKLVLFPARYLYIARTGVTDGHELIAADHAKAHPGDEARLVSFACQLRSTPMDKLAGDGVQSLAMLLRCVLPSLYLRFARLYSARMQAYGEIALAARLASACHQLARATEAVRERNSLRDEQ